MTPLNHLWRAGADFLGAEYAIMGGAMTWISDSVLTAAISNSGGFGVIAAGAMEPEILDQEIKKTKALTNKNYGVNLIIMHPKLEQLMQVCFDNNVTHIVLAGGPPKAESIAAIKCNNVKLMCFAPTATFGRRLVKAGVDAIIIEGSEAGGHVGPVSTSVLAQEILPIVSKKVPVFIAGGIGTGNMMLRYLQMGASGCQLGTMFACTKESRAHAEFKQSFFRANSRDAVLSAQIDKEFPVIPVRALQNKASIQFVDFQKQVIDEYRAGDVEKQEAQLMIEKYWAGALRRAVIDGDVDNGSLMAGQCVGLVTGEKTVAEVMRSMIDSALEAMGECRVDSVSSN